MKICIISSLYPPYVVGGGETLIEVMAKAVTK